MRKEFNLPENDVDFLNSSGFQWETIQDKGSRWLIIYNYPVPNGYNANKVNVALKIAPGYPVTQIDMVFFDPYLQILSGKAIRALAHLQINGKNWQRWSRHRTGENPWRPGLDDVSTHLQMVTFWMERELKM